MNPIRVLYVNGGIMHRGGIESYMMNYYRNIDRDKVQFDFIVHGFNKGYYDDEIKRLGGNIYNVPIKSDDYRGNIRALRKIFLTGKYKIIHSHMDAMSMVVLREAEKCNIPVRIAHSHNTQHLTRNILKFFLNEYARLRINKYATNRFACSMIAGKWLFGKEMMDAGNVKIIHNAIDLKKFKNDGYVREELRAKLNLNKDLVIGHIGRFDYQKNHKFLLKIFKRLLIRKPNAKLVLVGDGQLRKQIEETIMEMGIKNKVILLGERSDVYNLLNIFDVFLLPSHFEGLPVVLIEAQAVGIPCVASDIITNEADITGDVCFKSLEENEDAWVDAILQCSNLEKKIDNSCKIINAGYSIELEAKKLQKIYLSLQEKHENESYSVI